MVRYLRHRRFQPAALALMLASFASAISRLQGPEHLPYRAVGIFALATAVAFAAAWCCDNTRWMRWAFMASTALWVFIAGTSWTLIHSSISAIIALAWAVLAAGSWWLESADKGGDT